MKQTPILTIKCSTFSCAPAWEDPSNLTYTWCQSYKTFFFFISGTQGNKLGCLS
jgi:hypothetical protein